MLSSWAISWCLSVVVEKLSGAFRRAQSIRKSVVIGAAPEEIGTDEGAVRCACWLHSGYHSLVRRVVQSLRVVPCFPALNGQNEGPAGRSRPRPYLTRRVAASFGRTRQLARHGTTAWTWLRTSRRKTRPRIPAARDSCLAAKCWRGGTRCCCYGSPAGSSCGSPSGRSTVDC